MSPQRLIVLIGVLLAGIAGISFTGITAHAPIFAVITDTVKVCGTSTTLTTSNIPAGYGTPTWNNGTSGNSLPVSTGGNYWWQVTGTNVVTNGDFSAATTNSNTRGFTSAYSYKSSASVCAGCCCGVLSTEGTYTINTNPNNIHTNFSSFGDHTTGSGNMLIVNGSATANVVVWTQNINVQPNTDYVFSAWATAAHPANPAQLQFSIDGVPLGSTINPTATTGSWQYFTATWNSGSRSGALPIALVNQNIATSGNDFAVDDIVFAPVYRKNLFVVFNAIPVLTLSGPNTACLNYDLSKVIVGYDAATYTYVFKDSNGNIIPNVNGPVITQSGTYSITAENKVTGCTSLPVQTTVTVTPNPQKPNISSL
ncbi:hypothetical protein [Mucilaginibacter antarcticus]|uniref:CBM-cenC domain-containing protein n=1 Tax=Mucilaginibacter antarcticus TaxID=1855725 RepID=A0ABW5XM37_9SPHI